jgi:hypothetical protein
MLLSTLESDPGVLAFFTTNSHIRQIESAACQGFFVLAGFLFT